MRMSREARQVILLDRARGNVSQGKEGQEWLETTPGRYFVLAAAKYLGEGLSISDPRFPHKLLVSATTSRWRIAAGT